MNLDELASNLALTMPFNVTVVWACALLLVDLFIDRRNKWVTAALAAAGLAVAMLFAIGQVGAQLVAFNGMLMIDGFSVFLMLLFLGSGLAGIGLAYDHLKHVGIERGEYYILLMFSISGMVLMSMAADLIVVFLALELLSIPLYVLAGFARPRRESEEAALKYFLLGAYSGAFVVFGVALVFGATGNTALAGVLAAVSAGSANLSLLAAGAALILIGLGFKVGAVPFHMWTPDVYQGAPSPVTAFMSVAAKAGGFAALLRVFVMAFPALVLDLTPVLWGLAALTMILGNLVAISQTNIKRLLAYSSIAHAGYLLMAVVPFGQPLVSGNAVAAALFYLLAYALTSFAAWSVVIGLEQAEADTGKLPSGLDLNDYAGMGKKYPLLAAAMAVAMLSFTGVPPTLGFVGKFFLFRTVLEGGFVGLALIGVLTSLVSAYYYLRVVVVMYMQEGEPVARRTPWITTTAATAALATVILSLFSAPLFNWAAEAVLRLL